MSRRSRYSKNNLLNTNPPRNRAPNQRGHSQQFGNGSSSNSYSQHDTRYNESRPIRGSRGRGKYRGTQRNDLRNTLRNNNHVLTNVNREDETFKVTIPMSEKYDQLYLMTLLRENFADPNVAFYNFQKEKSSYVFYVAGSDTAETLRDLSRRISTHTGQRLVILTTKSPLPCANLDDRVEVIIKNTMSRLYDLNTRVMDLSNFRQSDEFKQHGLFITIGKANILRTVVEIIVSNTPNLRALNFANNRMNFLEQLRPLSEKCPELMGIDLSKNKIHSFDEIRNLKGLKLAELVLEGNPFIDADFTSRATYISAVRKLFPDLKKLDNEDLPGVIGFDLGVTEALPETKDSYIPPETGKFVYEFLEAYYKMYDSDNRQALIQAYHDNATFSYSFSKHDNATVYKVNDTTFKESHNILRLKDESLWVKFVKTSNVDIVSFLCKFPTTEHDASSFKIDIPFCESNMVIIVVNGTYIETFKANKPMRSFCRTFFVAPQGSGFVIVNEMLVVSNPSSKQALVNKKQNDSGTRRGKQESDRLMNDVEFSNNPSTSSDMSSFGALATSAPAASSSSSLLINPQEEILLRFMQVTNMNRSFAIKCLEENNYNAEAAYAIFQQLQASNMIPPEAFTQ